MAPVRGPVLATLPYGEHVAHGKLEVCRVFRSGHKAKSYFGVSLSCVSPLHDKKLVWRVFDGMHAAKIWAHDKLVVFGDASCMLDKYIANASIGQLRGT